MAAVLTLPGRIDYRDAHVLQQELLEWRILGDIPDVILLLEHEEVITVGRTRGAEANLMQVEEDVPVVHVERGGDVTWHGPGQLVAYPIVKLDGRRQDLHLHMHSLEQAVIGLLSEHKLRPVRDDRNTGVWLPVAEPLPKKVASIGIACKRWVTWHGLSLNVDNDLGRQRQIQPCGFTPSTMTRMVDHVPKCPSVRDLMEPLAEHLLRALELERSSQADEHYVTKQAAMIGAKLPRRSSA